MKEEKEIKEETKAEKKIKTEERKIKGFFKNLDNEKLKFLESAIHQLAVLQVTLERLAEEINKGDVLENFEQGSQKFKRENPALKSYNTTIKSYTLLHKQLVDMLPDTDAKKAGEALLNFAARPQIAQK